MSRARCRAVAKTATAPTLVAGDATEGGPEGRLGALERRRRHAQDQPGRPREVGDHAMHLHVHLIQRLLHPLDAPRALGPPDWPAGVEARAAG